jgi:hypothetical protein
MTTADTGSRSWAMVDEGWGRKAVDFATLSEPGNCREYVALHHRLGVDAGDRLLDVACGSGLAVELARLRGASGSGEQLLAAHGFGAVERVDVPFAWEFADPEVYARALAATGPAYEAIQNVGEAEFHRAAVEEAQAQLRDGLPLRADINLVGYVARKPAGAQRA